MKIFITGNAGAGKSTLARSVGQALGLPVHGLDRIVWRPGWRKAPPEERQAELLALMQASESWIIEGVSQAVLEAADVIVFLDLPRWYCLLGCARRNWRYMFRSRPDLPENCPEILIIRKLITIILRFPGHVRPSIMAELEKQRGHKPVMHLTHRPTADDLVTQLRAWQPASQRQSPAAAGAGEGIDPEHPS